MNRRLRLAGALVALVALSAYFAENVWASVCMPGMETEAAAEASSSSHAAMGHEGHDSSDGSQPESGAPQCPLGMVGMGGSCVVVSLPTTGTAPVPAVTAGAAASAFSDTHHSLLLALGHFRPPRA